MLLIYLDDIILFGASVPDIIERLEVVLQRLRDANLKLKPKKCHLFQKEVHVLYLGHIVSADGVRTDPAKIETVKKWPTPKNSTELRSFLGLASYCRQFVKNFSQVVKPLTNLTKKDQSFVWNQECEETFLRMEETLTAPILAYPQLDMGFILDTDADNFAIRAVLSQVQEGKERVMAYAMQADVKTDSVCNRNFSSYPDLCYNRDRAHQQNRGKERQERERRDCIRKEEKECFRREAWSRKEEEHYNRREEELKEKEEQDRKEAKLRKEKEEQEKKKMKKGRENLIKKEQRKEDTKKEEEMLIKKKEKEKQEQEKVTRKDERITEAIIDLFKEIESEDKTNEEKEESSNESDSSDSEGNYSQYLFCTHQRFGQNYHRGAEAREGQKINHESDHTYEHLQGT
ncbi:trichohyalin-like [Lytechinus variegatus]|uniref:trichohyalin-like n=1 Tax=Lytechinus variegatus TaxID=7654 RepID=UPI001BB1179A|nr:trichohyalin-like [Lytechinus variegatus]